MSTLDDALSSSAPMYDDPALYIEWKESVSGESAGVENLYNMSDTLSGAYQVDQSFDDALPDVVTMTGSADASGKLSADMIGRQGVSFNGWTAEPSSSGQNAFSNTVIPTTIPATGWGSILLMAVTVPSATARLSQGDVEGTPEAWDLVASQTDGATTVWVYTARAYTGMPAPTFYSDVVVSNTVWACTGFKATDPVGSELTWRVNAVASASAPSSTTTHVQPAITSTSDRATFIGVWAAPGPSSWTVTAPDTAVVQYQNATNSILIGRTTMYFFANTRADITAVRAAATAEVAMVVLAIEPYERPDMSPNQFWSPFNTNSPVYGRDRDTAGVELAFKTITEAGSEPITLFTGQMDDISLSGDQTVSLDAESLTRITLNKSVNLPLVFGRREGGSIDFLMAWIAARADRFIGPAPGYQARWWVPCYGSIHAGLDSMFGYNYAMRWTATESAVGVRYPEFVEGPFHTAVYACHTLAKTIEVVLTAPNLYKANEIWPWVTENYSAATDYLQPLMDFNNNAGRVSFWIRGDATYAGLPPGVPGANGNLAKFELYAAGPGGNILGAVSCWIGNDRKFVTQMGSAVGGYSTLVWSGVDLPTDDAWHFYSMSWSYEEGTVNIRKDGSAGSSSAADLAGNNSTTNWYADENAMYAAGGTYGISFRAHLPFSDFIYEAGYDAYNTWTDIWPTAAWPSFTMDTRPTGATIEVVPDESPVNAWQTLADLARNTMSWYRSNENDQLEVYPRQWFGEPDQQVVAYTVDTDVNAQDLSVVLDSSKSRNVVTVTFPETTVDTGYSDVLALTTSVDILPGTTDVIFTLDTPAAEIHGASDPLGSSFAFGFLSADNIDDNPDIFAAIVEGVHYMFVNTLPDGSGTYVVSPSINANIVETTQTTVTIRFKNKTKNTLYLANDYQGDGQRPYVRVLGYAIRQTDAWTTERDNGMIGARRERAMEVQMDWIHDRFTAQQFAAALVTKLSRPRAEVGVVVAGDPRRVPGQLVTLSDPGTTRASGGWRVLAITHNVDGAEFTQALQLVAVYPAARWDKTNWSTSNWGA